MTADQLLTSKEAIEKIAKEYLLIRAKEKVVHAAQEGKGMAIVTLHESTLDFFSKLGFELSEYPFNNELFVYWELK